MTNIILVADRTKREMLTMSTQPQSTVASCKSVYITNSKLKAILSEVDLTNLNEEIVLPELAIEINIKRILSQREIQLLSVYQLMLRDPEDAYERFQKIKKSSKDNSKLLFVSEISSYHCDPYCSALHSDFVNFELPPEVIRRADPQEISRVREFANKNKALFNENQERFIYKLQATFGLKEDIKEVSAPNSGSVVAENYDLASVLKAIVELVEKSNEFRNQTDEISNIINKFGYGTHKRHEATDPNHPLYTWHHTYKTGLKLLLQTYFRIKFNPDLKFEGLLLDQLGFSACNLCCKPHF